MAQVAISGTHAISGTRCRQGDAAPLALIIHAGPGVVAGTPCGGLSILILGSGYDNCLLTGRVAGVPQARGCAPLASSGLCLSRPACPARPGRARSGPALPGCESDHDRAGQSFRERERAPVALKPARPGRGRWRLGARWGPGPLRQASDRPRRVSIPNGSEFHWTTKQLLSQRTWQVRRTPRQGRKPALGTTRRARRGCRVTRRAGQPVHEVRRPRAPISGW
jgi:hypothetical protein